VAAAGISPPRTTEDTMAFWAAQRDPAWVEGYRDSWDRPYRRVLVEQISSVEPLSSVLELGCHAGPNLRLLAARFPNARVMGVDVNEAALAEARRSLTGFPNVTVACGDLRGELERLEDRSVDCVVSCFVLAYVDPSEIGGVLEQAWRVARKGLALMEPHPRSDQPAEQSGWRHDYVALLTRADAVVSTQWLAEGDRLGELNAVTIAVRRPSGV
jgi:SAM-dependent methyltransferase